MAILQKGELHEKGKKTAKAIFDNQLLSTPRPYIFTLPEWNAQTGSAAVKTAFDKLSEEIIRVGGSRIKPGTHILEIPLG